MSKKTPDERSLERQTDPSGDNDELQALFDSIVGSAGSVSESPLASLMMTGVPSMLASMDSSARPSCSEGMSR